MALRFKVVCLLVVCFYFNINAARKQSRKPNVLFILSDDQGYRDVGYHGSIFPTPVIDKLAEEGVKLENYYVQPMCTPTRSQFLTGRYQIRTGLQHGVIRQHAPFCLPTDEITIAQKMKEAGYSTHLAGKWHLGYYDEACLPNNRGFDSFLGLLLGAGDHYTHSSPSSPIEFDFHREIRTAWEYNGTYSTFAFTKEVINIILNKDENSDPFFVYLAYTAPHTPLQVSDEYQQALRDIFDDDNRLKYAAMVTAMDYGIGRIVDVLKAKGIYENTVIIYSGDNGGQRRRRGTGNNWPLRGHKGTLYEGGVRTIGFVHSPLLPNIVKGTVNNELIHVSDWFPTIVEGIAGWNTEGTKPLDGVNQWRTIKYGVCSRRDELLHNIDPLDVTEGGRDWVIQMSLFNVSIRAAIRYKDWKLITGDDGNVAWYAPPDTGIESIPSPVKEHAEQLVWLFNIKNDPREMNDLSAKRPEIVKFLLKKLQNYLLQSVPVNYPDLQPIEANPCLNGNDCVVGPWT